GSAVRRARGTGRRRVGDATAPGRASGDGRRRPGVRRDARSVVALGRRPIRSDATVADRHRQHGAVEREPRAGRSAGRIPRGAVVADELAMRRRRAAHPAMAAADRAFAAMPGPLLRWGVAQFDPTLRSPTVTGNTVLSSVNRGPADLRFGSAAAVLTAGFPALSPMMGLTHGVHGIGDTVTISIYAAESAVADIDSYAARLAAALDP